MANKFRSLMKVIGGTGKHKFFESTSAVGSATGKAQEKFNTVQNIAITKYNNFAKQINSETGIFFQDFKAASLEPRTPLPKRIQRWWQWYQQLTGLDVVETNRMQVIVAQDNLFRCQEERRLLNKKSNSINDKLRDIYGELISTRRDDPRYVQLTITENKFLQDQTKLVEHLNLLEKEERDHFTLLATAIKEYHDSQTANAQKYKYLYIFTSAALSILWLTGSKIFNWFYDRRIERQLQSVITEAQEKQENAFLNRFHVLNDELNAKLSEIRGMLDDNNNRKDSNQILDNNNTEKVSNQILDNNNTEKVSNQGQGMLAGTLYWVVKPVIVTASGIGAASSFIIKLVYGSK